MTTSDRARRSAMLLPLALLLAGCGYTVSSRVGAPPGSAPVTVALSPFRNMTRPYEPGLEQQLHAALTEQVFNNGYRLEDPDSAELVVTGELTRFSQSILSLRTDLEPSEVRIAIQVRVTVEQQKPVRRRWTDTLEPQSDAFALEGGETLDETAARAFRELARRIVERLVPPEDRWARPADNLTPAEAATLARDDDNKR